jgi:RNA polymerase sigma-70 factor (ECF subfamily)
LGQLSDLATATDADLLSRIKRREYPAFVQLFDRYRSKIVSFAARMTGDPDEAENLAHDAFMLMVNETNRYDHTTEGKPWLFKIARTVVHEFVSKNRPEGKAQLENLASVGAPPDPSGDARNTFKALNRLGPVFREVLYLRVFEGMSYEQIAVVIDEKPNAVKSRVNHAVEHLRKELK